MPSPSPLLNQRPLRVLSCKYPVSFYPDSYHTWLRSAMVYLLPSWCGTSTHLSQRVPTSGQDDSDREEWLKLIRPFIGTKWVHVAGEHSTNIVLALQHSQMRRETVLPALCKLCIREPEPRYAPLRDAVVSFMHSRRLSGHIIGVEYERLWINELRGTGTAFFQCPFLSRTNVLGAGPSLSRS
jgi:hypothetical protein